MNSTSIKKKSPKLGQKIGTKLTNRFIVAGKQEIFGTLVKLVFFTLGERTTLNVKV